MPENDGDIERTVRQVIATTFRSATGSHPRLGEPPEWDSLGHMSLVAALEDALAVRFPTYVIAELTDVPAIVGAVRRLSAG